MDAGEWSASLSELQAPFNSN